MDQKELVATYKKMVVDFCEEYGREGIYPFAMGMVEGAVMSGMVGVGAEKVVEKISAILEALKEVNEWR